MKINLMSFFMIDDWSQYEFKICQECLSLVPNQNYESSEEWICPICKGVYCCTICGNKHHTKDCNLYIPEEKKIINVIKLFDTNITECPNCKSKNLTKEIDRIECIRCGWVQIGKNGY